ncbi:MAG: DUF362 domain-containing protein [Ignavibacteria bacterium]|nr:DUF362 domain-containing protein [Ignavibacteria bacterium]
MKRRTFILSSIAGIGALSSLDRLIASPHLQQRAVDIAIITGGDIAKNVRAAVEAMGGMARFVPKGAIVFLKPNMSFPNPPEMGTTTHPEVIRAVAQLCLDAGAKRVIAADFPMGRAAQCFERSGMNALAASMKELTFVEIKEQAQFETIELPLGQEVKTLDVPRLLRKADVFINLPTAKVHSATTVSFGLKNLMGLFWDRRRFHVDFNLHNAIADLATVLKPQLTILDGTYLLLTNGPQGPGKTEQANTIIAGIDPLAVDAAGCGIGMWNGRSTAPGDVKHLALASERGLGSIDLSGMNVQRQTIG